MRKHESLSVAEWPLERIIPFDRNPRIITEAAITKVAALIKAYGWRQPIVVDEQDVIIVGHTRRLAALRLGLATAPVHVAVGLTAREAAAYRLADNRSNEEAAWDMPALAVSLQSLKDVGYDLALTAFDPVELPGFTPDFAAIPPEEVKRLDRKAEIACPSCGHEFAP